MAVPLEHGALGELFWSTRDAVAMVRDGRVIAWNPGAEHMFGVSAEVATTAQFQLRSVFGTAADQLDALIQAGSGWVRLELPGPRELTVEATAWRLRDSDVQVMVFRDLSGQARYERGLRELSSFARELLVRQPALPELAQWIADIAKELTDASYSALLLTRPGGGELSRFAYNAHRGDFPERLPRAVGLLGTAMRRGETVRVEWAPGHPDAVGLPEGHPNLGPFLAVPLPMGDSGGGEIAVANPPGGRVFDAPDERLLVDLAAHAAVALHWAEAAEQAHEEEQRRRDVTDAARHDIANPLSVGRGYLTLLEQRYDAMTPEQREAAFTGMRHAFDRLDDLSSRLLLDERLGHGGAEPQWTEIPVRSLLARLAGDHTVAIARRGITVDCRVEPECPDTLAGDLEMVREALDNLVGNAVKYSPEGSVVRVTARCEGDDFVRFDVSDSGPGIALEDQALLFQRFARTEASRRDRVPGMGLGLSIVRRLVAAHGGVVGLTSRPGEGSTFWVTFPARRPGQPGSA